MFQFPIISRLNRYEREAKYNRNCGRKELFRVLPGSHFSSPSSTNKASAEPRKKRVGEEMSQLKEKTVITIENYRRTTVYLGCRVGRTRCGHCNKVGQSISPGQAAELLQTSVRDVFRRLAAGDIHFSDSSNGDLLICRISCHAEGRDGTTEVS